MGYEIGAAYRLKEHVGHDAGRAGGKDGKLHELGMADASSLHPLLAGFVGTVVAVSPRGEHGGGPVDDVTVILAFAHHDFDFSDPNNPVGTEHPTWRRNVSFDTEQMERWFEPVAAEARA